MCSKSYEGHSGPLTHELAEKFKGGIELGKLDCEGIGCVGNEVWYLRCSVHKTTTSART